MTVHPENYLTMKWDDIAQAYFWHGFDGQAQTCRKCCRVIRWHKNAEGFKSTCCGGVNFMAGPFAGGTMNFNNPASNTPAKKLPQFCTVEEQAMLLQAAAALMAAAISASNDKFTIRDHVDAAVEILREVRSR